MVWADGQVVMPPVGTSLMAVDIYCGGDAVDRSLPPACQILFSFSFFLKFIKNIEKSKKII
jgi:hypothetical protein